MRRGGRWHWGPTALRGALPPSAFYKGRGGSSCVSSQSDSPTCVPGRPLWATEGRDLRGMKEAGSGGRPQVCRPGAGVQAGDDTATAKEEALGLQKTGGLQGYVGGRQVEAW